MKPKFQRIKQPTPEAMTADLLNFLRTKFYQGEAVQLAKDHRRLLAWVVLWPASWLNAREVTIHGEAYKQIFYHAFVMPFTWDGKSGLTSKSALPKFGWAAL